MAACHEPIKRIAKQILDRGHFETVLDLGCGNGMLLRSIAIETGAIPFGIELDTQKAHFARRLLQRFRGDAIAGNIFASRLPWPKQVVDLAIVPMTAFLEAPQDQVEHLRGYLAAHARNLLTYAYDDDRQRFRTLADMARAAGIRLVGSTIGETASLAEFSRAKAGVTVPA